MLSIERGLAVAVSSGVAGWIVPAGIVGVAPLGLAVVGGLIFSQFLTLYVTPVFYVTLDRFQSSLRRKTSFVK
jgi:multidrug efflux pump subunit AcrB